MVRNRKPTRDPVDHAALERAALEVRKVRSEGGIGNVSQVARVHNVAVTSLRRKIKDPDAPVRRAGRSTILPPEIEQEIVGWFEGCIARNLAPTLEQFSVQVSRIARLLATDQLFNGGKGGLPSYDWCHRFFQRHGLSLRKRTPHSNTKNSAAQLTKKCSSNAPAVAADGSTASPAGGSRPTADQAALIALAAYVAATPGVAHLKPALLRAQAAHTAALERAAAVTVLPPMTAHAKAGKASAATVARSNRI
jgi:Tc5 transposase DNA-binding domain